MRILPPEYISEITKRPRVSTLITEDNSFLMCTSRCIMSVLTTKGILKFKPNWLDIGILGEITIDSEYFFVINLSDKKAGELSFDTKYVTDLCMVFQYKYMADPLLAPILFQGLSLYQLVGLCKSLNSKSDPFYNLCKKNIDFLKLKAIDIGINKIDLPNNDDPSALKTIIKLIKNKLKQNILSNVRNKTYTVNDYIELLTEYLNRDVENAIFSGIRQLSHDNLTYLMSSLSDKTKMYILSKKQPYIAYMSNPSLELQLMAVSKNGTEIRNIESPPPEVQLAAVEQNGLALKYIANPTDEIKLAAVKQNGYAIHDIKKPSEEMKLEAVKRTGQAIEYIKDPSPKLQLAAVKQNGLAIKDIKDKKSKKIHPTEDIQLAAVKQNGLAIKYIKNPSPKVQLAAVMQNKAAVKNIKSEQRTKEVLKYL